ncbi:MAG: hypothetical protein U9N81_09970 [Bacillota bacterium]|nr:hypothetical protein [Bacillota bacterium]
MKKRSRNLVALCSLIFMVCFTGIASAAEAPAISPPTIGTVSCQSESIVVTVQPDTSTTGESLIKKWTCGIVDNHNGTVTIMASTNAYTSVDYLSAKVYLQHWSGSKWVDVASRTYSNTNSSMVNGSAYISVNTGDYYRTRCVHTVRNAGGAETQSSVSDSILVQ